MYATRLKKAVIVSYHHGHRSLAFFVTCIQFYKISWLHFQITLGSFRNMSGIIMGSFSKQSAQALIRVINLSQDKFKRIQPKLKTSPTHSKTQKHTTPPKLNKQFQFVQSKSKYAQTHSNTSPMHFSCFQADSKHIKQTNPTQIGCISMIFFEII